MTLPKIVIATRASALALWQAESVRAALVRANLAREVELLELTTEGDRRLAQKLSAIGGKGLFVKELETALAEGRADIAVHSMKDVPMVLPEGFAIACTMKREKANDVFISSRYARLEDMPEGAVVGTSSLRREMFLRRLRPGVQIVSVRGNVATRLRKLDEGFCDALVMAYAGIHRLGLDDRIAQVLPEERFLPSPGQGALAVECLETRGDLRQALATLDDAASATETACEREVSRLLGGSCQVPLAAYAVTRGETLDLRAAIGNETTGEVLETRLSGSSRDPIGLARRAVEALLAQGASRFVR